MACKLDVILARKAPKAVILRRGGRNLVRLILWHTDTDELELGQWFKGTIQGGDLSPDGSLFIYYAVKRTARSLADAEYRYAWTAISRPPYFTALALWPAVGAPSTLLGAYSWRGGGLFLDDKTVQLNNIPELSEPHAAHQLRGLRIIHSPKSRGENASIWWERMSRDGWVASHRQEPRWSYSDKGIISVTFRVYERADPRRRWTIILEGGWDRGYFASDNRVWLRNNKTGQEVLLPGAYWADWDQQGRLVFARDCELLAASKPYDMENPKVIGEFASQKFEPVIAPDWATHW